jgi:hypothetical protein
MRLICIGQSGIGYYAIFPTMPPLDEGTSTHSVGAMLICDAAIVSHVLRGRYKIDLVTNSLGPDVAERQTLHAKLSDRVTVHEPREASGHLPFDFILIATEASSRTYITTDYYPSRQHIRESLQAISTANDYEDDVAMYFDVEYSTPGGVEVLAAWRDGLPFSRSPCIFNVGHIHRWDDFLDWLSPIKSHGSNIFQVSFRGTADELNESVLRSTVRRLKASSGGDVYIVITLGDSGALLAADDGVSKFPCNGVAEAFTVGAGAVFSACLVENLLNSKWRDAPNEVLSSCVGEASQYVASATSSRWLGSLSFW